MTARPRPAPARPDRGAADRGQALARALSRVMGGGVAADIFSRGRYATDASIYQIMPLAVAFPRDRDEVAAALAIAAEHEVPVIARGGGTSQNGQPIGAGLVLDFSRHLGGLVALDVAARTAVVRPGTVLERLNAALRPHGLFFPVEPSTASRCTIGGMAGNNSCGARSLAYGKMVGQRRRHRGAPGRRDGCSASTAAPGRNTAATLARRMRALAEAERSEIEARFPRVQRRVGGYNLDALLAPEPNLAELLVGSEGTLAVSTEITLRLAPLPAHRVIGRLPLPELPGGDGDDAAPRGAGADRGGARRQQRARPSAPTSRCFAGRSRRSPGARPTASCWWSSPARRATRSTADLARLDACMADHGFRRRGRRGDRARGAARRLGDARGLPQHHDVDEGRREAGELHRGLRGAARASGRLRRGDHRALRPARHARHLVRARLGRLPARAADPRHQGCGRASERCGRSPRRPSSWCAASRARIRASTATASRARSSTSGCSARGWCAPSRRSRTPSIRPAG